MFDDAKHDPLFDSVKELIIKTRRPSVSLVQRVFKLGYKRAEGMVAALEGEVVTTPDEQGKRSMLHCETMSVVGEQKIPSQQTSPDVPTHENTPQKSGEGVELNPDDLEHHAVIKVIGVGEIGCKSLNLMIEHKTIGVDYIAISENSQSLERCHALTHKLIEVAGNESEILSEIDRSSIAELISDANIVFIVAEVGEGVAKDVSAFIAKIAGELNILTIAIVISSYLCAESCMPYEEMRTLRDHVDSLIVIPMPELRGTHEDKTSAYQFAISLMRDAVITISDMVNAPGLIGVDFTDVRCVMSDQGMAMLGAGTASGVDRARRATELAFASPLFETKDVTGARGVLVNITSSSSLKLRELDDVMGAVRLAIKEATIIMGAIFDEAMGDEVRVTIVATGIY